MITIDVTMFIQIVNILVLIVLLNAVLYRPVRTILTQREQKVSDMGKEIDTFHKNAKLRQEEFDQKLNDARREAKSKFDSARSAATEAGNEKLAEIRAAADEEKSIQLQDIETQFATAQKELGGQVDSFANEMAGKILGRAL